MSNKPGTLYGIGVGPGDPGLLTLNAVARLRRCPLLAFPCNRDGESQARAIVADHLDHSPRELPIPLAFDGDPEAAARAYDAAATVLAECLDGGDDAALLCEGDPLLFGSFIYLLERLGHRYRVAVVPGITAMQAAAAAALQPLTRGDQSLALVPANATDERIRQALDTHSTVVFYKPGRRRSRLLTLIDEAGRRAQVIEVTAASRPDQAVRFAADGIDAGPGAYFAVLLVSRNPNPCR